MARKSQALIAAESEIAQLKTQVGVLMSQLEASNQARKALQDERDDLIIENERLVEAAIAVTEELDAAKERLAKQGQVIAAQPKSAPPVLPKPAPKPLPVSAEIELAPVVSVTDADKAIWSKFQRLSREERMTIINWARPQFGHVGIHNIVTVRAAWHEFQAQSVA